MGKKEEYEKLRLYCTTIQNNCNNCSYGYTRECIKIAGGYVPAKRSYEEYLLVSNKQLNGCKNTKAICFGERKKQIKKEKRYCMV